ncbi:septum formation protein Maf [Paenibacillus yonginensis]|uniref:dTTP/UTP pyrophosphatase n=1 Tax=Paenibacillus yonginensis TaxID=1462996 RepID=A0A1B1N232_9BACL|nr:Maf family protein [Paenibacillus yonginensis]ANS75504.1 septum formation protein Maf [Paenibacillus yonginensis]
MKPSKSIILASTSPRRQELITVLGIPFSVIPSYADETLEPHWSPEQAVCELASRKARQVYDSLNDRPQAVIVGSDTVVVRDGEILGKPEDKAHAVQMITSLQGRQHEVYTGVACLDAESGRLVVRSRMTRVTMKPLSESQVQAYVSSGEGLDKAGAYGIQGLGAVLVTGIEGDYFNVVGLPLSLLADMLAEFELDVLNGNEI